MAQWNSITIVKWLAYGALVAFALYLISDFIIPVAIAFILAFSLRPLQNLLCDKGLHRYLASTLLGFLVIILFGLPAILLSVRLAYFLRAWAEEQALASKIEQMTSALLGEKTLLEWLNLSPGKTADLIVSEKLREFQLEAADSTIFGKIAALFIDTSNWVVPAVIVNKRKWSLIPFFYEEIEVSPNSFQFVDLPTKSIKTDLDLKKTKSSGQRSAEKEATNQTDNFMRETEVYSTGLGPIGNARFFLINTDKWTIDFLVVQNKERSRGELFVISAEQIDGFKLAQKRIECHLEQDELDECPSFYPNEPINRESETRLYDYFGHEKTKAEKSEKLAAELKGL